MRHFSEQDLVLGLGSNKQQAVYFRQALEALTIYFGDVFISSVSIVLYLIIKYKLNLSFS